MLTDANRISGNALDGTYQDTMTVPAFAQSGTWTVQTMLLVDQVGNQHNMTPTELANAGLPNHFTNN